VAGGAVLQDGFDAWRGKARQMMEDKELEVTALQVGHRRLRGKGAPVH
jgi:hypothetical protein